MLKLFLENYFTNYHKLSTDDKQEMAHTFFTMHYGGEKEFLERLNGLKEKKLTDEEIFEVLKNDINFRFFESLLEVLAFENITELIKLLSELKQDNPLLNLITDQKGLKNTIDMHKYCGIYTLKKLFAFNIENISKEDAGELAKKGLYTSKEAIAKEFGCSKRTLNKWMANCFGERFTRKERKISIIEYIEIFEAFFLSDTEDLDLNNDLDLYLKRLKKGLSFTKSDIAFLCDSDLKIQKGNLKETAFYSSLDKFPYSLSQKIASKMGTDLEF